MSYLSGRENRPMDPRNHFDKKNLCHRCLTGIDNNRDGDCGFCHRLTDNEAQRMRAAVLIATMYELEGKRGAS